MKAEYATGHEDSPAADFYRSTLAPINDHNRFAFRGIDAVLFVVLFLEIAGLARLILAT